MQGREQMKLPERYKKIVADFGNRSKTGSSSELMSGTVTDGLRQKWSMHTHNGEIGVSLDVPSRGVEAQCLELSC